MIKGPPAYSYAPNDEVQKALKSEKYKTTNVLSPVFFCIPQNFAPGPRKEAARQRQREAEQMGAKYSDEQKAW